MNKYTIDKKGNWKAYTNTIPMGCKPIGVIKVGEYDTGALMLVEATGLYIKVNANVYTNLEQNEIVKKINL